MELRAGAGAAPSRLRPRCARRGPRGVPHRRGARAEEPRRAQGLERPRADGEHDRRARCRTWRTSSRRRATRSDAPLFVREAKDVVGKLRDRLQALTPRPGRAARVVAAALDLTRATPPFPAAIAHALIESVRGGARARQARGGALRLRRHAVARRRCAPRAARRRAGRGDAAAVALRAHRRVPGHRRDAVVDLPPRVLREGDRAHAGRAPRRRRSEAVDLPLSRRGRGDVPRRGRRGARIRWSARAPRRQLPRDARARRRRRTGSSTRTRLALLHRRDQVRARHVRPPRPRAGRRRRRAALSDVRAAVRGDDVDADAGRVDRA